MISPSNNSNYPLQPKEWNHLEVKSSSPIPPPVTSGTSRNEVDEQNYRFEAVRLRTFEHWTIDFIDPKDLAAAGFYYLLVEDRVRCFECKIEVHNWEQGDIPMVDHKRYSPRCRFIRNIPCGNVPIGVDPDSIPLPKPREHDVCGIFEIESQPLTGYSKELSDLLFPADAKLKSLGVEKPKLPTHPQFASLESRIRSFDTWPKPMPPTKLLADAGFFFSGENDQTLCFQCGGGLKDWEPDDDPWQEHLLWFPKCHYLLMCKGREYTNVKGQNVKLSSSEQTGQTSLENSFEDINLENNRSLNISLKNNGIEGSSSNLASSVVENKQDLLSKGLSKPTDDGRLCKICFNAELGIVFLPCKHMVACVNCASRITTCAICRKPISHIVQAILA